MKRQPKGPQEGDTATPQLQRVSEVFCHPSTIASGRTSAMGRKQTYAPDVCNRSKRTFATVEFRRLYSSKHASDVASNVTRLPSGSPFSECTYSSIRQRARTIGAKRGLLHTLSLNCFSLLSSQPSGERTLGPVERTCSRLWSVAAKLPTIPRVGPLSHRSEGPGVRPLSAAAGGPGGPAGGGVPSWRLAKLLIAHPSSLSPQKALQGATARLQRRLDTNHYAPSLIRALHALGRYQRVCPVASLARARLLV
jgi:hypothetical protein